MWQLYNRESHYFTSYENSGILNINISLSFGYIRDVDGRLYDPVTARFLSPDIYVQSPDFTQSYNRYSFCFNNPLSYVDPGGYNHHRHRKGHSDPGRCKNPGNHRPTFWDRVIHWLESGPGSTDGVTIFLYGGDVEYNGLENIGSGSGGGGGGTGSVGNRVHGPMADYQEPTGDVGLKYINSLLGMEVVQKQTNWCAFAIGEMIFKKLYGLGCSADQTLMANEYYREHKLPEYSNIPATVQDYLLKYFSSNSNYFVTSWNMLVSAVQKDIPVLSGLKGASVGHAIYIYGVSSNDGVNVIYYWDPGRDQGYRQMNFNDFLNKTLFVYAIKNPY